MATTVEEHVKETLKCKVCYETLTDPRTLPCMHTYCCKCLDKLEKKQGHKLGCPECRQLHMIPKGGVTKFQVNYTTNTLVDMLHSMDVSDKPECTLCKEKHQKDIDAISKCIQCNKQFCKQCQDYHDMFFQGHAVIDLTSDEARDMNSSLGTVKQCTVYCETHKTNPLEIYCKVDSQAVCATCYVIKHSGHECVDIHQAAEDNVKLIDELLKKGEKIIDNYVQSIQSTQTKKDKMENEADNVTHELNNDMNIAIQALRNHYTKNIKLVAEKKAICTKQAIAHLEDLNMQKIITESAMSQLRTLKQHGHDAQLANMAQDIATKSKEWSTPKNTGFNYNITFRLQKGEVFDDRIMLGGADKDILKVPLVFKAINLTKPVVVERTNKAQSAVWDIAVTANNNVVTTGYQSAAHTYNKDMSEKAKIDGRFTNIAAKNDEIYLTNNTKTISIYNQDGKHSRDLTIPSLQQCGGIAVNSNGELVVCDTATRAIYHINSTTGRILTKSKQFSNPHYVAVNSKDVVIVSDNSAHCVVGLNREGTELFRYGTLDEGQNQLNNPLGLCTDRADNIIVADYLNNRIHLLTPEGKFIQKLLTESNGLWWPNAVAMDNEGHVLVGDEFGCIWCVKYTE